MEQKLSKKLIGWYYGMLVLAVIAATTMYLLISKELITPIDPLTVAGQIVQYIVIGYVIISVPGALAYGKWVCKKIIQADEDTQFRRYFQMGLLRIVLMGIGMALGIVGFYLLQANQSMILCAGISAIGLIFCKPNARKIELELLDENPEI